MADLESCYFCGSVEDLGEYATPPDRLLPADHDSQSAVLCADCRQKLRTVLEPIAERIERLETAEPTASVDGDSTAVSNNGAESGEEADERDQDRVSVDELAAEAAAGASPDTPDEYRRVLRLLRNRELPMEREAVVGLVSGAYDVEESQCEEILETAIERGDLGESGGQITN